MFDGLSFDPFALFDDGLSSAEAGVGGRHIVHRASEWSDVLMGKETTMARSSQTIRDLNDRFSKGDPAIPGRVMITCGVQALIEDHEDEDTASVLAAVRGFETFDPDNDPYGEHDFGAFDFLDKRLFWKLDYYAPDMQHGSEDPATPLRPSVSSPSC